MSALEMPPILNRIAAVGPAGLELEDSPAALGQIELCRAWGFHVQLEGGRALLSPNEDLVVPVWVEKETKATAWDRTRVRGFFEIGSTNDEAISDSRRGVPEGSVIYAERQTEGRGRLGRKWISPARSGMYFSLVLRPRQPLQYWPILNHAAAVALFRSLRDLQYDRVLPRNLEIDLKWPNDVLLSGKKTAGILLESVPQGDTVEAAVLGVGINIMPEAVPVELRHQATSVAAEAEASVPRRWLLVRFLDQFQLLYKQFSAGEFLAVIEAWKSSSTMWNGVEVTLTEGERRRAGRTCGLTETGALRVRMEGGREEIVLAGDVSVRRR
jgi:BirA family biotin operon repressor/biotin-[acetyl-CoA-carboxylase] ligase